ncbi:MAG: hypothetical protein MR296_05145 [Tenericutes bacterium]|nr:hypothetical protein [Mycoplasmatota bacterium]
MEKTNMERFMHNYISGNYINNKVNDEINNMYKNFLQSAKKIDNKKVKNLDFWSSVLYSDKDLYISASLNNTVDNALVDCSYEYVTDEYDGFNEEVNARVVGFKKHN